jgi:hypothetical protein
MPSAMINSPSEVSRPASFSSVGHGIRYTFAAQNIIWVLNKTTLILVYDDILVKRHLRFSNCDCDQPYWTFERGTVGE